MSPLHFAPRRSQLPEELEDEVLDILAHEPASVRVVASPMANGTR
jgi:hypothetical protein